MALTRLRSPEAAARWLSSWVQGTLRTDSRLVQAGDAFIAWPGYANDGRRFVKAALDAGATTCLVEAEAIEAFGFDDARVAALPRLKAATGAIAHAFFDHPGRRLDIVAATGTNGKTSTAWWTAQALTALGRRCGVIGTLGIGEPGSVQATGLTTPDPVTLHATLRQFADRGFAACALEASSIGLVEHRLDAAPIDVALFTNFTRDHLDYHRSMATYWAAKRQLFDWPGLRAAVLNIDDAQGAALAAEFGGLSADHIEHTNEAGVRAMADAGSVAVLLPGAFHVLRETKLPPLDLLREHGVPMAVATDCNPGTSPLLSLRQAMQLACTHFKLTPEEALRGTTINAARALGLHDRGMLRVGLRADFAHWRVARPAALCYWLGGQLLDASYAGGRRLV